MKKNVFLIMTLFIITNLFISCQGDCELDDACLTVSCLNGGSCSNGTCACLPGYEGEFCDAETRTKFYGQFNETLTGAGQVQQSVTTLESAPNNVTQITWDGTQYMEVVGMNNLSIPSQPATGVAGATVSGNRGDKWKYSNP